MSKTFVSALIPTVIAVIVFALPIVEIYTLFYLTPTLGWLASPETADTVFYAYTLTIPVVIGLLASMLLRTLPGPRISQLESLYLLLIPGITLSLLSTLIGRYDLVPSATFLVALAILPVSSSLKRARSKKCRAKETLSLKLN